MARVPWQKYLVRIIGESHHIGDKSGVVGIKYNPRSGKLVVGGRGRSEVERILIILAGGQVSEATLTHFSFTRFRYSVTIMPMVWAEGLKKIRDAVDLVLVGGAGELSPATGLDGGGVRNMTGVPSVKNMGRIMR